MQVLSGLQSSALWDLGIMMFINQLQPENLQNSFCPVNQAYFCGSVCMYPRANSFLLVLSLSFFGYTSSHLFYVTLSVKKGFSVLFQALVFYFCELFLLLPNLCLLSFNLYLLAFLPTSALCSASICHLPCVFYLGSSYNLYEVNSQTTAPFVTSVCYLPNICQLLL